MRHPSWQYLINWVGIMADRYGTGSCWEKETNELCAKEWDWGQALMRLAYGPEWMSNLEFQICNDILPEDPAPKDVIMLAQEWEKGKDPEWFDRNMTIRKGEIMKLKRVEGMRKIEKEEKQRVQP